MIPAMSPCFACFKSSSLYESNPVEIWLIVYHGQEITNKKKRIRAMTNTNTNTHTHTRAQTRARVHAYAPTYIQQTCSRSRPHTHANARTSELAALNTCAQIHMRAVAGTRARTHIHQHDNIYMYTWRAMASVQNTH